MTLRNQSIEIDIPASEIIPKCRLIKSKTNKDSDVTGYYTDDNLEKKTKISSFFGDFSQSFLISYSKVVEYRNNILKIIPKIKSNYRNGFETFESISLKFCNKDLEIPKMKFGGETGRYLKFENSDPVIADFKELLYENLSNLVIEKDQDKYYIYPVIKKNFYLSDEKLNNEGHFILPSNPNIFLVEKALENNNGIIDWGNNGSGRGFKIGDIVYLYSGAPVQKITHCLRVIQVDISYSERLNDDIFWLDEGHIENKDSLYDRLALISNNLTSKFTYNELLKLGLKSAPRNSISINENYPFLKSELIKFFLDSPNQIDKLTKNHNRAYSPLNIILYGPPGTGKTFYTAEIAVSIIENRKPTFGYFNNEKRTTLMSKYNQLVQFNQIEFCTFHQSYGYEDFIEGYRPSVDKNGSLSFSLKDGILKTMAKKAIQNTSKNYVLIIDEINRGNISKIFGELITLIEADKRMGEVNNVSTKLPSGTIFGLPNNLFIIGTMNTADKSISLLDVALRRRFEFIEMPPQPDFISDPTLKEVMINLNDYLKENLSNSDLLIGHSFFINNIPTDLSTILNNKIIPLLYEYFNDQESKIEGAIKAIRNPNIIIVENAKSRIRVEMK